MEFISAPLYSGGLNLVVMVATYISSLHGENSPSGGAALLLPSAVNSTEKAKHRQQTEMLDMWITLHGDNLYPCREEKERIAKDMSMSYVQVNRWFANRRRKQTKRSKCESGSPRHAVAQPLRTDAFADDTSAGTCAASGITESGNSSENMVINAVIPDSDSVGSALLKTDISQEASPHVPVGFQQATDLHRPVTSPSLMPDRQRIAQTSMDTELLPTPPTLAPSSLTAAFSSAAVALTAAAAQSANPFIVAAALSMQQNLAASLGIQTNATTAQLPWNESPQALTAMLPYLQQLHAHAQQAALAQQLIAAQQAAAAAVTQQQHQQMANTVPQTPLAAPQQWLSPPPSATASIPDNASSPLLLNGDESYSSLSEISELSPQPRGDVISPFKEPSLLFTDEDLVIDSLIEERRDLSEKESIAVAVLAGMAACQR
uniref:Homeobox domain-containing protein n=1 Tax=Parascaris univalens TaxID=6257 RepID=A0A914ZSF6_PARUN